MKETTLAQRFAEKFELVYDQREKGFAIQADILSFIQAELLLLAAETESLKYPTEETSGHAAHNQTVDIVAVLIRSKAADLL